MHEKVRRNIEELTKIYARKANKREKDMEPEPCDMVWIHLIKDIFLNKRKSKLMPKIDGPFQMFERVNNNAYKIDLQGKYTINSNFNVSDLITFVLDEIDLGSNPFKGGGVMLPCIDKHLIDEDCDQDKDKLVESDESIRSELDELATREGARNGES